MTISVCMTTYNHEKFIAKAIEGILIQKCNFQLELVIGEDFSNDKTHDICNEYATNNPQIILLQSKSNIGIIPNFIRTLLACTGKYIAICEGDDYWTDPNKLQKQVDFLERNPDYGMVHTGVNVVDSNNNLISISDSNRPSGEVFYYLLKSAFIVTCSACFRSNIAKEVTDYAIKNHLKCVFDYWLWLHIALRSKIHYKPGITSAYRSHSSGVTQSTKEFFNEISPLAVLDAVSYKLIHFPEKECKKKWELYVNYCRALTASSLSWNDRSRYFRFLLQCPIFLFAFFPAVWRKIKLRFLAKA
jgi:glycosyltransferase involved in cell wall biosynthesis